MKFNDCVSTRDATLFSQHYLQKCEVAFIYDAYLKHILSMKTETLYCLLTKMQKEISSNSKNS